MVLFRDSDRVAIVGDVLRNINFLRGTAQLGEPPHFFSHDPLQNRHSIRLVHRLRPGLLLFGHGPPLRDVSLLDRYVAGLGPG